MVEDDPRFRKRPRQPREFLDLRMVEPSLEGKPEWRKTGKSVAKSWIIEHASDCAALGTDENRVGIPRHNLSHSTKSAAAGSNVRVQDLLDNRSKTQIAVTHNAHAHLRRSEVTAGAHCGDAVGELGFANSAECRGSGAAMHCPTLDKHRGDYIVPGGRVL